MATSPDKIVDALRASLLENERLRRQAKQAAEAAHQPIAFVGMACRYPGGANSPEELWRPLERSGTGLGGFPADRGWDVDGLYDPDPARTGTSYANQACF